MSALESNPVDRTGWTADPWVPGMQTCDCGATREAPAAELEDAVRVVMVAVEARRAA